jgi:hypothetical protein
LPSTYPSPFPTADPIKQHQHKQHQHKQHHHEHHHNQQHQHQQHQHKHQHKQQHKQQHHKQQHGRFLIRLSDSVFSAPQSDLEKNQNAVRKGLARNAQIRGVFGSPP